MFKCLTTGLVLMALSASFLLVSSCAVARRPHLDYNFSQPLLNERWVGSYGSLPVSYVGKLRTHTASQKSRKQLEVAEATGNGVSKKKFDSPRTQPEELAKPGSCSFLPAAQRIVGIRNSFDSDSFLKHLLFVNNIPAPKKSSLSQTLWTGYGKSEEEKGIGPGSVLFFGQSGKPSLVAVLERKEEDGRFVLIAPMRERVERIYMYPNKPSAHRAGDGQRVYNTMISGGITAANAYMGVLGVRADGKGTGGRLVASKISKATLPK